LLPLKRCPFPLKQARFLGDEVQEMWVSLE
jgi:hypothetical protein